MRPSSDPKKLWQGKLTIAFREWVRSHKLCFQFFNLENEGCQNVSEVQLVCSGSSISIPEVVQIDPNCDVVNDHPNFYPSLKFESCQITFTALMPNERLPSYIWPDHSLILLTSTTENKESTISQFEQVAIFLAEVISTCMRFFR